MKKFAILFFVAFALFGQPTDYFTVSTGGDELIVKVDPRNGMFSIGTGDGIPFTRGFDVSWPPATDSPNSYGGYFVANIGGDIFSVRPATGGSYPLTPDAVYLDSTRNEIVSIWIIPAIGGSINLTQTLRPTAIDWCPFVEITYSMGNSSAIPSSSALKIVTGMDGAAVTLDGSEPVAMEYTPYDIMPPQFLVPSSYGWPDDTLILKWLLDRDPPDFFFVGEYDDTTISRFPIYVWPDYTGRGDEHYEHPAFCLKWSPTPLPVGSLNQYRTYIGFNEPSLPIITADIECRDEFVSDCTSDTTGLIRVTVRNHGGSAPEGLVAELDFSGTSLLIPTGPTADTAEAALGHDDRWEMEFNFAFNDSLFLDGPLEIIVPLIVYDITGELDTVYAETEIHIPYFDGLLPTIETEIIGDEIVYHIDSPSEELDWDFSTISLSTLGRADVFTIEDSIFTLGSETVSFPLRSEYVTESGLIFSYFGETEICLSIVDIFGCSSEACTLVTLGDYDFPVSPRWNLFSIPTVDTVEIMPIFTSCVTPAYTFEPDSDYYPISETTCGMGFWITGAIDTTIYYGDLPLADSVLWNLQTGWNMVGPARNTVNPADIDLGSGADGIFWGFDPETFRYFATTLLIPGRGYFVFAPADTTFWVR